MRNRRRQLGFVVFLACLQGTAVWAQSEKPLSVIDWLGTQAPATVPVALPSPQAAPPLNEPPVTSSALSPAVSVQPLSQGAPRDIGLVPQDITGLPVDLWVGSDIDALGKLIADLPDLDLPAAQSLLYTVLLAEGRAPGNDTAAGDTLALARVEKLVARGALDPALSLIENAGITTSSAHFDLFMQISLLTGTEDRACSTLDAKPNLTASYGIQIFCDARGQRWENAALKLGSAKALGLLPKLQLALLERFIDPDAFEALPTLTPSRDLDPLSFRLFETIGEPVPTANLPRAFAVADLRDIAGWKAQIEAAERLTRAGALPDNRLLGLYSDRRAAASGGVWDRVAAWQRFETALQAGSSDAVAKTLPAAWRAVAEAELEVSFAALFADRLGQISLTGRAAEIARTVLLLSASYEVGAGQAADLPAQIARGETGPNQPSDVVEAAIHAAFNQAAPRADLVAMAQQSRLGESILHILTLLHEGTRGNARALTEALASLRALGLEDTARRASLQLLLLERS